MENTSRFIQLTSWLLLEYQYSNTHISNTNIKHYRIDNHYYNKSMYLNSNTSKKYTENILNNSVAPLKSNYKKWAHLSDKYINPIYESDDKINLSKDINIPQDNMKFDTIKLHIVAGFNLEGLDGIITNLRIKLFESNQEFDLINNIYKVADENINFTKKPLYLGDRIYNKYIEFKVPALSQIKAMENNFQDVYIKDPDLPFHNLRGVKKESNIYLTVYEIDRSEIENGVEHFYTGNKYETSFLAEDQFSYLSAKIRENISGDFFEYFGVWDNNIIFDYIKNLNQQDNGVWAIIHDIRVTEQVGEKFIDTTNFTTIQNTDFHIPNLFRPIIIHADIAFSFSITYTMRLFNSENGQQIIRKASYTSTEPKKYGQNLKKIKTLQGYTPVRVYNKILTTDKHDALFTIQPTENKIIPEVITEPTVEPTIEYVTQNIPVYFNRYNLGLKVTMEDFEADSTPTIEGMGKANIFLSKFDNFIKFYLYDKEEDDWVEEDIDANQIYLSFILDNNEKIYIDPIVEDTDKNQVNFKINSEIANKILNQDNNKFYLISKDMETSFESLVYYGKFHDIVKKDEVQQEIDEAFYQKIENKIKQLRKLEESIDKKYKKAEEDELTVDVTVDEDREIRITQDIKKVDKAVVETKKQLSKTPDKRSKKQVIRDVPGTDLDLSKNLKDVKPKLTSL